MIKANLSDFFLFNNSNRFWDCKITPSKLYTETRATFPILYILVSIPPCTTNNLFLCFVFGKHRWRWGIVPGFVLRNPSWQAKAGGWGIIWDGGDQTRAGCIKDKQPNRCAVALYAILLYGSTPGCAQGVTPGSA